MSLLSELKCAIGNQWHESILALLRVCPALASEDCLEQYLFDRIMTDQSYKDLLQFGDWQLGPGAFEKKYEWIKNEEYQKAYQALCEYRSPREDIPAYNPKGYAEMGLQPEVLSWAKAVLKGLTGYDFALVEGTLYASRDERGTVSKTVRSHFRFSGNLQAVSDLKLLLTLWKIPHYSGLMKGAQFLLTVPLDAIGVCYSLMQEPQYFPPVWSDLKKALDDHNKIELFDWIFDFSRKYDQVMVRMGLKPQIFDSQEDSSQFKDHAEFYLKKFVDNLTRDFRPLYKEAFEAHKATPNFHKVQSDHKLPHRQAIVDPKHPLSQAQKKTLFNLFFGLAPFDSMDGQAFTVKSVYRALLSRRLPEGQQTKEINPWQASSPYTPSFSASQQGLEDVVDCVPETPPHELEGAREEAAKGYESRSPSHP